MDLYNFHAQGMCTNLLIFESEVTNSIVWSPIQLLMILVLSNASLTFIESQLFGHKKKFLSHWRHPSTCSVDLNENTEKSVFSPHQCPDSRDQN